MRHALHEMAMAIFDVAYANSDFELMMRARLLVRSTAPRSGR